MRNNADGQSILPIVHTTEDLNALSEGCYGISNEQFSNLALYRTLIERIIDGAFKPPMCGNNIESPFDRSKVFENGI